MRLLVAFSILGELFIFTTAFYLPDLRLGCLGACPPIYYPVCGSNGKTYNNHCELFRANCKRDPSVHFITQSHIGECRKTEECPLGCPMILEPVCGSNGKTYPNRCVLLSANCRRGPNEAPITQAYLGKCMKPKPCPLLCPLFYEPVCGSNGKTYVNSCELDRHNCERCPDKPVVTKVHDGKCRKPEKCRLGCPKIYEPVCGSDGKTYGNMCELIAANCIRPPNEPIISQAYRGECRKPECPLDCPMVYEPVCGSDGRTYKNLCDLSLANCDRDQDEPVIEKLHDGECKIPIECPQICPLLLDPLCGSDGKTYNNQCELDRANCDKGQDEPAIEKVHDGECGIPTGCPVVCPLLLDPLCGSDGKTYDNHCELDRANCDKGQDEPAIEKVHDGECEIPTGCPVVCPLLHDPLCGSDGKTYDNQCELERANCDKGQDEPAIEKVHDGKCKKPEKCRLGCPKIYNPVCGSDGKTYGNLCQLIAANCTRPPNEPIITHDYRGVCRKPEKCRLGCPKIYNPVCGSDGKTYGNLCQLIAANCTRPPNEPIITHDYRGVCRKPEKCRLGCPKIYNPVCGSDGKTYGNLCQLIAANCTRPPNEPIITHDYRGVCRKPEKCRLGCPKIYEPVCGSDGKTYGNLCQLIAANCTRPPNEPIISQAYRGECRKPECPLDCPMVYEPVCGSDGRSYKNLCELSLANCDRGQDEPVIEKLHDGECKIPIECPEVCPLLLEPLCGSDGKTYNNQCELDRANCDKGQDEPAIEKVHDGECEIPTGCPVVCPLLHDPLCGSDGKTYANQCELDRANCDKGQDEPVVEKLNDGECKKPEKCRLGCPKIYNPVCGSDGKTYGNLCELIAANCTRPPNEPIITQDYRGVCRKPEKCRLGCPKIYEPVCGSDGKTYGNLCQLIAANCTRPPNEPIISQAYKGECRKPECPLDCPMVYEPVCGSDGRTHKNLCELSLANCDRGQDEPVIEKLHDGECKIPIECPEVCPLLLEPLCGSDGKTYNNQCELDRANCDKGQDEPAIEKVHDGECEIPTGCPVVCPLLHDPLCGSDGKTYANQCELDRANCDKGQDEPVVEKLNDGECKKPEKCRLGCPKIYNPVCGSDGKTYGNLCELIAANCTRPPNEPIITQDYRGVCRKPEKCRLGCPKIYEPVCGSDGKTYGNLCQLIAANCTRPPNEPIISQAYRGECRKPECPLDCPMVYEPVCGSDGRTHKNLCELSLANCDRGQDEPVIEILNHGECRFPTECPEVCPLLLEPLCGSDGKTYDNQCQLDRANCDKGQDEPSIQKVRDGEC